MRPTRFVISCCLEDEDGRSVSFSMREFIALSDNTRLLIRDDRGWSSGVNGDNDQWQYKTADGICSTARNLWEIYLDEAGGLAWVLPILHYHGITSAAVDLEALPVEVELSREILDRVRA